MHINLKAIFLCHFFSSQLLHFLLEEFGQSVLVPYTKRVKKITMSVACARDIFRTIVATYHIITKIICVKVL